MDRQAELKMAIDAARAAARVCRAVQETMVAEDAIEKRDKSPVTVADFASQAIVCSRITAARPGERIVAEETAADLLGEERRALREAVVRRAAAEAAAPVREEQVLAWIEAGTAEAEGSRYWTLDPIDGTKGFLGKRQYAVAVALIENGRVVLGVLACPNLPADSGTGALFAAVEGGRARTLPLWNDGDWPAREIRVAQISSPAEARFCESFHGEHSDQKTSAQVAARLGITAEPYRIDSQCKYAAVARNDASIYLRLPTRKDYREKIWDHAAGKIIVEAAGGRVTDIDGNPLDFTCGRTLDRNRGIAATCGGIHEQVLEAIREARS